MVNGRCTAIPPNKALPLTHSPALLPPPKNDEFAFLLGALQQHTLWRTSFFMYSHASLEMRCVAMRIPSKPSHHPPPPAAQVQCQQAATQHQTCRLPVFCSRARSKSDQTSCACAAVEQYSSSITSSRNAVLQTAYHHAAAVLMI